MDEKAREKEQEKEQEKEEKGYESGYHSLFWPVLLIGIGVIFLLETLEIIDDPWSRIFEFWPVLLIVIGLDILFGRSGQGGALVGAGLGVVLVVAVILLAIVSSSGELQQETFTVPAGGVERSRLTVEFYEYEGTITSSSGREYVLQADVAHYGDLDFKDDPEDIQFKASGKKDNRDNARWNFELSEAIHFDEIVLDMRQGSHRFDLRDVYADVVEIEGVDSDIDLSLPATLERANVAVSDGRLDVSLRAPDSDSRVAIDIEVTDAQFTIDLPELTRDQGIEISLDVNDITMRDRNSALERYSGDPEDGDGAYRVGACAEDEDVDCTIVVNIDGRDAEVTIE